MIRTPKIAARAIEAVRQEDPAIEERAVVSALGDFERLWAALFPAEQARIVRLLVERVTVGAGGLAIDLRQDGLASVLRDLVNPCNGKEPAR